MNYPQFVKLARSYAKASDEAQIRLLRLLMDVHEAPAIWQSKHSTWEEVLRAEKFCTVHRYTSFRKAVSLGISPEKLGVDAACLLATYSSTLRKKALTQTRSWIEQHRVPPTYQLVAEYVKELRPTKKAKPKPKAQKIKTLWNYILKLQAVCKEHGITYPPPPAVS